MSNQNKNKLGLKEFAVVGSVLAAAGALAVNRFVQVEHVQSSPNTHLETVTRTGLGPTGREGGTSTLRVPVANGTDRTP